MSVLCVRACRGESQKDSGLSEKWPTKIQAGVPSFMFHWTRRILSHLPFLSIGNAAQHEEAGAPQGAVDHRRDGTDASERRHSQTAMETDRHEMASDRVDIESCGRQTNKERVKLSHSRVRQQWTRYRDRQRNKHNNTWKQIVSDTQD